MTMLPGGGQPTSGGRRAMSSGMCITLIVIGAVLRFAITERSPHGLNIHVVGLILILAGVRGLVLPFLTRLPGKRAPRAPRAARADRQQAPVQTRPGAIRPFYDDRPVVIRENGHRVHPIEPDWLPASLYQAQASEQPEVPPDFGGSPAPKWTQ
jgi:hypothetical protein